MKILVTGAAGFIGFHLCKQLLNNGHDVIGIDNLNEYYSVDLKFARLEQLKISKEQIKKEGSGKGLGGFEFYRLDLTARQRVFDLFGQKKFDIVCNLAAQAGVRYSLEKPDAYVDSNITGFLNILEACRYHPVKHLVYASSSSVYGLNTKIPFAVSHEVNQPISMYAVSKRSNELMAHSYSHLFGMVTTGLRFFTVYGPWGRPDMALFLFTKAIINNEPIKVFNNGNMERDFTYVDDIVEGVTRIIEKPVERTNGLNRMYNIGNNKCVKLTDFIEEIEAQLGIKAQKEMLPMQAGDVAKTWADVDDLAKDYGYRPNTSIEDGVSAFLKWYKGYNP